MCRAVQGSDKSGQCEAGQKEKDTSDKADVQYTAQKMTEHNDPSKCFRLYKAYSVIFIKLFLFKLLESILINVYTIALTSCTVTL